MTTINLRVYGIVVTLDGRGSGSISSDLKEAGGMKDNVAYNAAISGIESLILAQACMGCDVTSPAYLEALEVAVEACSNNLS